MVQEFPEELDFPFPEPTEEDIARNIERFAVGMIAVLREKYQRILAGQVRLGHIKDWGKNEGYKIPDFVQPLRELRERAPKEEVEAAMQRFAGNLWANRRNLVYDGKAQRYFLKGPDLYDPENPPELPDDLRPVPPATSEPEEPAVGSQAP
jgi:hypothetical protein